LVDGIIFAKMLQFAVDGIYGLAFHVITFPISGMLLGLLYTVCVNANSVYNYKLQDTFDYLKQHGLAIYQVLVFDSIAVGLAARLTNSETDYTSQDLLIFPVYTVLWLLTVEVFYYFFHIAMHRNQFLWKHVHSLHHSTEYSATLQSLHLHPIESLSGFGVPVIWVYIFGKYLHILNFYGALGVQFFVAFNSHSATTVNLLPNWLVNHPLKHEVHHKGNGNFAPFFGFLDKWFGTAVHENEEKEYLLQHHQHKIASDATTTTSTVNQLYNFASGSISKFNKLE
jgi:sterol desaturase/sphingolipid hydroxylase (fatty acid hydroxylase superfamily)